MKLLMLLPRVPYPLEKGDKLRAYHQLRVLSSWHEIHLCCLNEEPLHQEAYNQLKPFCKTLTIVNRNKAVILMNLMRAMFSGKPFQTGYFYSSHARRTVRNLVNEHKPDHIYCQLLRTAGLVSDIDLPKTLDYQDVFSKGIERRLNKAGFPLRLFLKMEYHRLLRYEHEVFDLFDNKTIISSPDRELIPHPGRDSIHVIPNGVDFSWFRPMPVVARYDLLFTGNMAYPPNIDAAEFLVNEIMPLVWEKRPMTSLAIAGASPARKVRSLQQQKVNVMGWMEDIREAYSTARVFIAPMRIGTGLQNKLLEAMAMRLPCITSTLANMALEATPGKEILVGKTAEEFAMLILQLLEKPESADRLSRAGYDFVNEHYSWEHTCRTLSGIFAATKK